MANICHIIFIWSYIFYEFLLITIYMSITKRNICIRNTRIKQTKRLFQICVKYSIHVHMFIASKYSHVATAATHIKKWKQIVCVCVYLIWAPSDFIVLTAAGLPYIAIIYCCIICIHTPPPQMNIFCFRF